MQYHPPSSVAVLSRRKGGILRHVGLLLPDGRVAHCSPGHGEHISPVEEFSDGQDVTIERLLTPGESAVTMHRISQAVSASHAYDALTNNCEIFAHRMIGEIPVSPQLQSMAVLVGLAALLRVSAR